MGLIADVTHYNACVKTLSNDKQRKNEVYEGGARKLESA